MVPSFITWNRTSRSMVSSRNAVSVISFSGSSSNGYHEISTEALWNYAHPYLALKQISDLLLNTLCLSKQALVDCQPLETTFAAAHVVDLCRAILDSAAKQVFGVGSDVVALSLHCYTYVSTVSAGSLVPSLKPE
jgi:hypothetical protein